MTLTDLFRLVGAPLANQRWSWGAVRPGDGAVFLRVWQDECATVNGLNLVQLTFHEWAAGDPANLGYAERLKHVALISGGSPSFMIMCCAADTKADPRKVASFNDRELFVGGKLIEHAGDAWLERAKRCKVREAHGQAGTSSGA